MRIRWNTPSHNFDITMPTLVFSVELLPHEKDNHAKNGRSQVGRLLTFSTSAPADKYAVSISLQNFWNSLQFQQMR
jgi:hypothetical protein